MWDKFKKRCQISKYNARNCINIEIPKINLEKTKYGFHYTGLSNWNNIPNKVKARKIV